MNTPHKIVDSLLVLKIKGGSQKAMALLVKRWHGKFCRHAYGYTKDMDTAKDVAQDSWKVILRKIHQLRDENSFGGWALQIVTRRAIDSLRKDKKHVNHLKTHYDTLSTDSDGNSTSVTGDALERLRKAITELPENQKITLQLFYLDEFNINQISEILNVPVGTIKSRLFKAREGLKIILKNTDHEK